MTRVDSGLSGVVPDGGWPRPRSWARPERLDASVDTLAGVGQAYARRLRSLGLVTVRDVLFHRPRRYESAADEIAISSLWGDDEVAIAGVISSVRSRRRGRLTIVTAVVKDESGSISATWFNQP